MSFSILIGTIGVTIILIAFVLNLTKRLTESSPIYLWMNIIGSAFAGWHAWDLQAWPLFVLEVVWALAAMIKLGMGLKK